MKRLVCILACLCMAWGVSRAQSSDDELFNPIDRVACMYHVYEAPESALGTPAPKGYKPFYISHYGRHGSRWQSSSSFYEMPLRTLRQADSLNALTEAGKALLNKMSIAAADAEGREGELTPRGVREHHGIAERMFQAYPEVFSTKGKRHCLVECRSTISTRAILSMAAFGERLKELNPKVEVTRECGMRYMDYMAHGERRVNFGVQANAMIDSLKQLTIHSERFVKALFTGGKILEDMHLQKTFMTNVYCIAADIQDTELDLSMYEFFTRDELLAQYELENSGFYWFCGPSKEFGIYNLETAQPLLRNIVESADEAIATGRVSASLRFGHDSFITPLLALVGIEYAATTAVDGEPIRRYWNAFHVTPMATNIQFVFFRNKAQEVIVKVMHNEKEVQLPIATDMYPYYKWEDARRFLAKAANSPIPEMRQGTYLYAK